jgi:transglutaminase-like putative cysteine protease
MSGFSERVELGEIGTIKLSDAVVMRVRSELPPFGLPSNLKWRGVALDRYDGKAWTRSLLGRVPVAPQGEYFKLRDSIQGTEILRQTYFLEALSTDVVFAGHRALAVSREIGILQRDGAGSLFTLRHPLSKIRYSVVSEVMHPDPELIPETLEIEESIRATSLQLPKLDPRIGVLTRGVTQGENHPFRKALRLERYLRTNYNYSLDLKARDGASDPVAMFLFDTRSGHCEYFASALTVMLRDIGIPSRLVNGFRSGEYNEIGRDWIVRQYDAHSWVEAYFPPYGWVEFDPTPPDPQRPRSEMARLLVNFFDAVGLWWSEEVVNYDVTKQGLLARGVRSALAGLQHTTLDYARRLDDTTSAIVDRLRPSGPPSVLHITIVILLTVSAVPAWRGRRMLRVRALRSFRRIVAPSDRIFIIESFYAEALDTLRKHGLCRRPDQTPLEFAEMLGEHPARDDLTSLTRIYNRIRFGAGGTADEIRLAEGMLRSLRQTVNAKTLRPQRNSAS